MSHPPSSGPSSIPLPQYRSGSHWLSELTARLGAKLHFAITVDILQNCTGTRISQTTVQRLTVESVHKTVVQVRLEWSGTYWTLSVVEALIALQAPLSCL